MLKDFNYLQFVISVAIMLLTIGIAYGVIQSRITALESVAIETKSDHDILIRISTNLETVQSDIKEIKRDLKIHLNTVK